MYEANKMNMLKYNNNNSTTFKNWSVFRRIRVVFKTVKINQVYTTCKWRMSSNNNTGYYSHLYSFFYMSVHLSIYHNITIEYILYIYIPINSIILRVLYFRDILPLEINGRWW